MSRFGQPLILIFPAGTRDQPPNELHLNRQSQDPGTLLSVLTSVAGIISNNKDFRQPYTVEKLLDDGVPQNNFILRQTIETREGESQSLIDILVGIYLILVQSLR